MKKKPTSFWGKLWYFIWHEDSLASWIVNIIIAFVLIKYIVYPGLGFIMGTQFPVVAVVSGSMHHGLENKGDFYEMCGNRFDEREFRSNFDDWWYYCGDWYKDNLNITSNEFKEFPLSNGFSRGDIIVLRGANNLEIGDIIVFEANREYPIIHRVIDISDENEIKYTTKGDHNPGIGNIDQNITKDRVYGKAFFKVPYLGYVKILFVDFLSLFGINVGG